MGGITFCVCSTTWVFRHILAAIWKVFSLKPVNALWLVPCRNEDKTQDLQIWWCKVSAKRMSRHKDRDLWSTRWMTTTATGQGLARNSKLKVPKCIDERRSIWPQGNLGRETLPDQKVKRTLLAQGNLMQYHQHWRTWDSLIINAWKRYSNAYRRNWEELR